MEKKKKYINPLVETIMIEASDVVVTSDEGGETPYGPTVNESNELDDYNY